jgi:phospholipase/lecithinase/hemolysin
LSYIIEVENRTTVLFFIIFLYRRQKMMHFKTLAAALGAALLVAACGGGGDGNQSPRVAITSVKVMGDSLADSGTFSALGAGSTYGRIFSVQASTHQIWTERVAASFGISSLCNVFSFTGATFVPNPTTGCTSYAVGGARINNPASKGGVASPFSVLYQIGAATAAGNHKTTDLLLIDGGGNDAADLVGAYLGVNSPTAGAGAAAYGALLSSVLDPTLVGTTLATGAAGFASIGGVYMTALADKFFDAIKANALDKGATHVAIVNMPGITNTPRFQMVLDSIAAAYGGGATGAGARAQSEALFKSWMEAFNAQLKARAVGNAAVVVVDLYTNFNDQIANPAQFGLTNVRTPACPMTGQGSDGLPTYNFETCTAANLSANPPAGVSGGADWWKTYAFSDGFHPTPYGHQLASQLVARSLAQAGWL